MRRRYTYSMYEDHTVHSNHVLFSIQNNFFPPLWQGLPIFFFFIIDTFKNYTTTLQFTNYNKTIKKTLMSFSVCLLLIVLRICAWVCVYEFTHNQLHCNKTFIKIWRCQCDGCGRGFLTRLRILGTKFVNFNLICTKFLFVCKNGIDMAVIRFNFARNCTYYA